MTTRLKRMWPDWLAGIQHYINGVNFSQADYSSLNQCKFCSPDDIACANICQSTKLIGQPFLFGRPKLNVSVLFMHCFIERFSLLLYKCVKEKKLVVPLSI
ncbi:unnamed protein product [Schistosoma mattheei]|uniref:Uncharacterized protein n=1 Tax=Schistosoma mattheei TaxID=31246 RepID=A0A183PEJ6_9TREM|nr:unnamed protein product [Schistosoma mattheei]